MKHIPAYEKQSRGLQDCNGVRQCSTQAILVDPYIPQACLLKHGDIQVARKPVLSKRQNDQAPYAKTRAQQRAAELICAQLQDT
eukprot:6321945-Amphidinium_carterae.1